MANFWIFRHHTTSVRRPLGFPLVREGPPAPRPVTTADVRRLGRERDDGDAHGEWWARPFRDPRRARCAGRARRPSRPARWRCPGTGTTGRGGPHARGDRASFDVRWCSTGATCDVGTEGRHARVCASSSYVANAAGDEDKDADESEEASAPRYESSSALATKMEQAGDARRRLSQRSAEDLGTSQVSVAHAAHHAPPRPVVKRGVPAQAQHAADTPTDRPGLARTRWVAMLTSSFVGMVFTIQFCKEFSKVGLTRVIGGLLGLAFTREPTPVICAIVLAGRVGSAIALLSSAPCRSPSRWISCGRSVRPR